MINKVVISNFKCFENVDIEVKALTVLSGINAVGKSSFIQSLLLVLQSLDIMAREFGNEEEVRIALNEYNGLHLGNISDILNFNNDEKFFKVGVQLGQESDFVLMESRINDSEDKVTFNAMITKSGNGVREEIKSLLKSQYISAERYGPKVLHDVSDSKYKVGEYGQHAVSIFEGRGITPIEVGRLLNKNSVPLLNKAVEEWMEYIIPNTSLRTSGIDGVEKVSLKISNSKDTPFTKPANTGFGISYVLPIVIAGMLAPTGSTIIVENPEAHLHPLGQSRIGEFLAVLAEFGVQIIVETHSDHLINGIRLSVLKKRINENKIIVNFFSKEDSSHIQVKGIYIDEMGEIAEWPKGFLDQERSDLREIFNMRLKR